eukprot:SAG22_NODE_10791_length_516_cov_0.613909_1_plen_29_part_10
MQRAPPISKTSLALAQYPMVQFDKKQDVA